MTQGVTHIACAGGCGKTVWDFDAASQAGWLYLEITRGWRCGVCDRELRAASAIVGLNETSGDDLPADSRGALPKATSQTILPPAKL